MVSDWGLDFSGLGFRGLGFRVSRLRHSVNIHGYKQVSLSREDND